MLKRIALATTLLFVAAGLARAEQVVVVELYTSQGCSSCPPADGVFAEIADRDDIIALALHVDYWDYIGWKDDFADPAHTERQRAYARAKGKTMIYTPQMVVHGETHVVGTKPMELFDAVTAHADGEAPVEITLDRGPDGVSVTADATGAGEVPRDMVVYVVTYTPSATREIRRGENAGRTLTYHNIVEDWRELATWSGEGPFRGVVRVDEATPVVVIVQAPGPGSVLGAARSR